MRMMACDPCGKRWQPDRCPWCPNRQELDASGACVSCRRVPDREACPLCAKPGRFVDRSEILKCPPEDCPEPVLPDFLRPVYDSHAQLGTDQGGKPTLAEQLLWFDLYGVTNSGERRTWIALWQVVTAAKLTEAQRRFDRAGKDSEA